MGLAIFEKYSQTKEGTGCSPFLIGASTIRCFDLISQWVKESGFVDIEENKDFWEIYGVKDGFEITITISQEDQNSLINISVFGKMGKTRKKLKEIISQLINYLQ